MSAKLGNCARCNKSVYALEGVTAVKKCFHKLCFKCVTCGWQLTLTNYKSLDGEIYCQHHFPVTGYGEHRVHGTVETDSKHIEAQYNAPKLDVVSNEVRGTGEVPTTTTDRIDISVATSAPKLSTVNQQVRGPSAGESTGVSMESIHIAKAAGAPKLDTVGGIHRGDVKK
eukprot:TRINITY_DN9886_c0_g1_i1.p1 TRINITY_DN9886_c0_g1~~TRINITY_DN9886_c0_g1_i1.p1  ORF type:complete len:170 (-),score=34.89 TRINITY_DN9886_c0_g1_i1:64-573(-)